MSKQLPQHWITPEKLANTGLDLHLELDGDTAPLVAEAIGVDQILSLSANLKVRTAKAAGVVIHGTIKARVEQKCVVTLEAVENFIEDEFQRYFVPQSARHDAEPEIVDGEMVFDPHNDSLPDVFCGTRLDLWDVMIEQLVLAVDLYPRSQKAASFKNEHSNPPPPVETHKPFEKLKALISEKKPRI